MLMPGRLSRFFALAILLVGPLAAATAPAPAQKMDPVVVGADVPLVKLGEFSMSKARFGAAAVADDAYLYVIGGADQEVYDDIERIDLRTLKSEPFGKLKRARLFHRAVVHDRKIHVLGGRYFETHAAAVLESDFTRSRNPGFPTRTPRATMPASLFVGEVEVVDLERRTVRQAAAMPVPKAHFGTAIFERKLYVIGGQKLKAAYVANTGSVEVFDFSTGQWSEGVPMPTARQAQAAVVGDLIVVPGGYTGQMPVSTVELFSPKEGVWRKLPDLSVTRSAFSMAHLGKHLFLFGDYDATDEILSYKSRHPRIQRLHPPIPARAPCRCRGARWSDLRRRGAHRRRLCPLGQDPGLRAAHRSPRRRRARQAVTEFGVGRSKDSALGTTRSTGLTAARGISARPVSASRAGRS